MTKKEPMMTKDGAAFRARSVWDGTQWKPRDPQDCPFGNAHYLVHIAPGIAYWAYCTACEPMAEQEVLVKKAA